MWHYKIASFFSFVSVWLYLSECVISEIDLQSCIDNFDVHRDKIIRTQDSQKMGAKYLNEIDLGGREECLRLCCETENCDVFVFEDKYTGSCYLFHCGPPEDFKCKFTHHVNYSSGVLAVNRHLPDLESQIKLTKHEQDLTMLKKAESRPPEVVATTTAWTTTTAKSKEVVPPVEDEKAKTAESEVHKCNRNQFECRNPPECIAIYNVCDGISQCADGSDEGPELRCPYTLTTPTTPIIQQQNPPQQQVQQNYQQNIAPRLPPPPVDMYRPQQDFIRPPGQHQVQYENGQNSQYIPPGAAIQNWNPGQHVQSGIIAPNYGPAAPDKNSHIFNHKENGIQVSDGQEIRYNNKHKGALQYLHRALGYSNSAGQYPERFPPPPKAANYYDNYRPIPPENWPPNPSNNAEENNVNQFVYPQEMVRKYPEQRPNLVQNSPNIAHPPIDPQIQEISKSEQEQVAHELKQSKLSVQEPTIKIEQHPDFPDVVVHKLDSDLKDGLAQTPGGAVLSLTLGLIITCIMALIIACRLKVKRRMRKGGKSYAHDADYLVNGMYL